MSEDRQNEIDEFTGTAVRLMRLTRENKISWRKERENPGASDSAEYDPTLTTEINGLHFRLEDAYRRMRHITDKLEVTSGAQNWGEEAYRLVVFDEEAGEEIVSPPMQAASDLAAIVKRHISSRIKPSDVNRRLDEVLEP